jgi:hypothetical protein
LPLLERVRVEVYVPDPSQLKYDNLLLSLEEEFTYAFGGCTTVRGLQGSYLSNLGQRIPDRINLIYSDVPLALSTRFDAVTGYAEKVKRAAVEALSEEDVLISVGQVYHAL